MATITKRGQRWCVQIRRKGFPAQHGTFRTKSAALAWAREQEGRIDQGEIPPAIRLQGITLGDLLRRYDAEVVPQLRGAAQATLRVRKLLRASLSDYALAKLSPSLFATYRDARLKEVRPQTVKHELALLSRIITLAQREWDIPIQTNPVQRIAMPIVHNARTRRLEDGEALRIREALKVTRNPLVEPAIILALETGMRRGELLGLLWRNVDLKRRVALLPMTKNGQAREVPLNDEAVRVLGALKATRETDRVLPMTPLALRLAWVRVTKRAGLEDLHFHDLRHEAISRYAEMGLTTPELALISGHRDMRMLARYTHLRPAELAAKLAGRSWEQRSTVQPEAQATAPKASPCG